MPWQWIVLEIPSFVDALAILALTAGALIFIARRGLRALRPAESSREVLSLDRSEQAGCASCAVARTHKS